MKKIREWKDLAGVWRCEVVCPTCLEQVEIRKSNSYKMKTCSKCADVERSKKLTTHGIHSKHFPNEQLKACRDKVSLMGWRVYSTENPAYEHICQGLDVRRTGEYEASQKLMDTIGVPPSGTTIEKYGRSYTCGTCPECMASGWGSSLLGWIEPQDQIWTRSTSHVFRNGNERRCLNKLFELIEQDEHKIKYLFYDKFSHIESISDRWMVIRQYLLNDPNTDCPECLKTIIETN